MPDHAFPSSHPLAGAYQPERTVLHVRIVTGTGGGPEKTILNSPRHLRGSGYRALAAYLHDPDDPGFRHLEARAAAQECPLLAVPDRRPIRDFRRVKRQLAELCETHRVDVWHGHDYKSNLFGVLLQKRFGFKLVTTVHGWVKHTRKTPLYYAIDRWTLPKHDAVIAVSDDLERAAIGCGVQREKLALIENAIDTDEFRRKAPAGEGRDTPPGRSVIGAVGRLSEEKGFDHLIRAVERMIEDGLDVELRIAGEGDREAALRAQIADSPHKDRLLLLGFQRDTLALFESFDVFCLSSLREGLPNVVLEAMSMEVPVVATRCGGMEAFARDGIDALLCPSGDAGALADALTRVLREDGLRSQLTRAARERIEDEFSFRQRMGRVVTIYDSLFRTTNNG